MKRIHIERTPPTAAEVQKYIRMGFSEEEARNVPPGTTAGALAAALAKLPPDTAVCIGAEGYLGASDTMLRVQGYDLSLWLFEECGAAGCDCDPFLMLQDTNVFFEVAGCCSACTEEATNAVGEAADAVLRRLHAGERTLEEVH